MPPPARCLCPPIASVFCFRRRVFLEVQPSLASGTEMHSCRTVECIASGLHLSDFFIRSPPILPQTRPPGPNPLAL